MADYKLSFTAEEIDEKLKKVQDTRVVIDLPIDLDTLLSETEIPFGGELAAAVEYAAVNLLPIYMCVDMSDSTARGAEVLKVDCTSYAVNDAGQGMFWFFGTTNSVNSPVLYTALIFYDKGKGTLKGYKQLV